MQHDDPGSQAAEGASEALTSDDDEVHSEPLTAPKAARGPERGTASAALSSAPAADSASFSGRRPPADRTPLAPQPRRDPRAREERMRRKARRLAVLERDLRCLQQLKALRKARRRQRTEAMAGWDHSDETVQEAQAGHYSGFSRVPNFVPAASRSPLQDTHRYRWEVPRVDAV